MLNIGEVVAAFTLTAEDGKTINPADFRVKKIVLYFLGIMHIMDSDRH